MSGPRYDLVPEVLPEATPWPREPEPEPKEAPEPRRWGKILFSAVIAVLTGIMIAGGANSADKTIDCHYLRR